MRKREKVKLFLVDDDALFLKALEIDFLEQGDFEIETFATGELCLSMLFQKPDLVILDYHLDGVNPSAMNGISTLDKIKMFNSAIPVVMLSSQDKIEVAVDCILHKATDYVVKSETAFTRLKQVISTTLRYNQMEKELNWYMDKLNAG